LAQQLAQQVAEQWAQQLARQWAQQLAQQWAQQLAQQWAQSHKGFVAWQFRSLGLAFQPPRAGDRVHDSVA
jgi:hypothetical protein